MEPITRISELEKKISRNENRLQGSLHPDQAALIRITIAEDSRTRRELMMEVQKNSVS